MLKLGISAVLWIALTLALNGSLQFGDTSLPPLGKFFSPGSGFWRNAEPVSGYSNHDISLNGLTDDVRIVFDERMVPHIFASNDRDAYYAQGYVTAMHRLWQMDLAARAAAGELSLILGERTLQYDRNQRQMGMGFAAENAVKGWEKYSEDIGFIEAYTAGVNAYMDQLKPSEYPVEYKLLDYAPQRWTPLKSAYFVKSMATRLCLEEDDLENSLLLQWLGKERFNALFPEFNTADDPVIPPGTVWNFGTEHTPRIDSLNMIPVIPGDGQALQKKYHEGSNNWAVSGARTKSGKPILCNDPHLGLSLPSVWYEVQLVTPEYNVYGVSLPGMPGVIIGFNEYIAWGMTNAGHDVLDWYRMTWTDQAELTYMLDGKQVPAQLRVERIDIKGSDPVYDTIRYTHWGPVQNDGPHKGLAMRWLAHVVPDKREANMFTNLNRAKSYEEYLSAIARFQTPAQNFVFADQKGNIALHIGGMLPLRHDRNGRFVQDGSISGNGWMGGVPTEQNPGVFNPPRGFVSSANQQTTDSTYPYIYHGGFEDFRGRMLNRLLAQAQGVGPQEMMALQYHATSLKAEEILPPLLKSLPSTLSALQQKSRDLLSKWNYAYDADAEAPVLFELWYNAFYELLWDEFYALEDSLYIYAPEAWRTDLLVMHDQVSPEFDIASTTSRETFADVTRMSFEKAIAHFDTLPESHKIWGTYRETTIRHLAQIPAFSRVLSHAPGHGDVLNATTRTHGPSWRMVVHLTDPVEAHVVYPGGQSGNPGSPYYDMMVDTWEKGEYYKVSYMKTPGDIDGTAILNLKSTRK